MSKKNGTLIFLYKIIDSLVVSKKIITLLPQFVKGSEQLFEMSLL
jgi:hypothetical protein